MDTFYTSLSLSHTTAILEGDIKSRKVWPAGLRHSRTIVVDHRPEGYLPATDSVTRVTHVRDSEKTSHHTVRTASPSGMAGARGARWATPLNERY